MLRMFPSMGYPMHWVAAKGGKVEVPDPAVQTNAEAAANRYDINSPFGKQTWDQGSREIIGYDSKGMPQYGQRYTQNIELNPSEQKQYDLHNQISEALLDGAGGKIQGFQDTPFEYGAKYQGPGKYHGEDGKFDYSTDTPEVAQAQFKKTLGLLKPQFDRQNKDLEQNLANKGLPIGSEAYSEAYQQQQQNQNQSLERAALDATTTGNELALSQRQQNVGEGVQNFGLNANSGLQTRQQQDTESLNQRQQQYNELAAALGGQQLNPLNGGGGGGASPLDVSGAFAQQNQAKQLNAQMKNSGLNSLFSGLTSLGSSAILASDERLKEGIEPVGELPTGEGVYEYSYKGDPERFTGVMAQEVEQTNPDAVVTMPNGYKAVDYRKVIARAMMEAA